MRTVNMCKLDPIFLFVKSRFLYQYAVALYPSYMCENNLLVKSVETSTVRMEILMRNSDVLESLVCQSPEHTRVCYPTPL